MRWPADTNYLNLYLRIIHLYVNMLAINAHGVPEGQEYIDLMKYTDTKKTKIVSYIFPYDLRRAKYNDRALGFSSYLFPV